MWQEELGYLVLKFVIYGAELVAKWIAKQVSWVPALSSFMVIVCILCIFICTLERKEIISPEFSDSLIQSTENLSAEIAHRLIGAG